MSVVTIEIFGDEHLKENLQRGARKAADMSSGLEKVAELMFEAIFQTFQSQGRRGGGSWQLLSEKYVKQKLKRGQDPRILFADHDLIKSVTEWGDENMELEIDEHTIRMESLLDYAAIQQYGGRGIPARPYIRFTSFDKNRWVKVLQDELMDALAGH